MMDNDGMHVHFDESLEEEITVAPYTLKYVEPLPPPPKRPPSPRVKPAAHYARVVANLLCDRPCTRPLSPPGVYADELAKDIFKDPLHGDNGFQIYVDKKYGEEYARKDIFHRELPPRVAKTVIASRVRTVGKMPVENIHCWLPIYTKEYTDKIFRGVEGCDDENKKGRKSRKGRSRHTLSEGENDDSDNSTGDESDSDDEYDEIIGPDGEVHLQRRPRSKSKRNLKSKSRRKFRGSNDSGPELSLSEQKIKDSKRSRRNVRGYDSEEDWEHDKNDRRIRRIKSSRKNVARNKSDEEWEHDKNGRRIRRIKSSKRNVGRYDSNEVWEHDKNGQRVKRIKSSRKNPRGRPSDEDGDWERDLKGRRLQRSKSSRKNVRGRNFQADWKKDPSGQKLRGSKSSRRAVNNGYNSDEEWEHDNGGKRIKRKPGRFPQVGDPDYVSDEEWVHDKNGKRQKRKHPLTNGRRPTAGDPHYNSDEEWVHNESGKRIRRKKPLEGGQRPQPGDLDYNSDEEWVHDSGGKRTKRRDHPKPTRGPSPQPGDPDYDSDEAWVHDPSGKRIKKKRKSGQNDPGNDDINAEPMNRKLSKGGTSAMANEQGNGPRKWKVDPIRKSRGSSGMLEKAELEEPKGKRKSNGGQLENTTTEWKTGDSVSSKTRKPSWLSTVEAKTGPGIKVKGVYRSQADLEDHMKKAKSKPKQAEGQLPLGKPALGAVNLRPSVFEADKYLKKTPPKSPGEVLKSLKSLHSHGGEMEKSDEISGEGDFDEAELMAMLDLNRNVTGYAAVVTSDQMEVQMSALKKIGCAGSLWGVLPIPAGESLQKGKVKCTESHRVNIQPNNVLKEDTTGAFGDYDAIPPNIGKYKQIFRDEARTLGLPRPSTAEVTSRMIERTAKNVKKKMEGNEVEDLLYPEKKKLPARAAPKKRIKKKARFLDPKKRSVPLATVLFDLTKRDPDEFENDDVVTGLVEQDPNNNQRKYGPFGQLHPGVVDDTARRFRGVTSGPFIPHVDRSHRNRITFSLLDNPKPFKGSNGGGDVVFLKRKDDKDRASLENEGEEGFAFDQENDEGVKLPPLAVREKTSSNPIINSNSGESPLKLPSISNLNEEEEEQEYTYNDILIYPDNNSNPGTSPEKNRNSSLKKSLPKIVPRHHVPPTSKHDVPHRKPRQLSHSGKEQVLAQFQALGGQGDQGFAMSPCWEMASKLFKTPLRAPAIPVPDNLVIFIEKKIPGLQWPRGEPVAIRYYPSGQPFCVVFQNGAGRVHYPHGGLAIAISAPKPKFSRVLVIRDPFDQFYYFDKAVMADFNCNGTGTIYDEHGIITTQYTLEGGYRQEGVDKPSQRWQWNRGGQRLVLKLNRYFGLRILDLNKVFLVFFGNKRGLHLNVGAAQRINLMSAACELATKKSDRPKSACGGFDYIRGRFNTPVIGFLDKSRQQRCATANPSSFPLPTFKYSFSQCNLVDTGYPSQNHIHDCYVEDCRDGY